MIFNSFSRFRKRNRPSSVIEHTATQNQARYVVAELAGSGSYMISMGHLVRGPFDNSRFVAAASAIVERHDALRTYFRVAGHEVRAIVSSEPVFRLKVENLSDRSFESFRTWALPYVFNDVDPLLPGSLIRFLVADYGDQWRFTIAAHHAITDGFSRGVMNRELLKTYEQEILPDAGSYYGHVLEQAYNEASADTLVNSLPTPARVFPSGEDASSNHASGLFVERDFSAVSRPLRVLAKSTETSRFAVMSAIYALTLSGQTGTNRLSSFFQSEGRKAVGASNSIVGPYSNTLPLDLSYEPGMSFADFVQEISARIGNVLALETQPLMELLSATGKVPTVSLNQYPPASKISAGRLEVGPRELLDRRTEYDLNLVWTDDAGTLTARAFYNPATLTEARAELFLSLYEAIVHVVISNTTLSCADILSLSKKDRLAVFPRVEELSKSSRRIHEAFWKHAQASPNSVAVLTSDESISYEALKNRALAYSAALEKAGAVDGERVAILASRCPEMVAALLGVSASGASFALIDASYPTARIKAMLEKLAPGYLIATGEECPAAPTNGMITVTPAAEAHTETVAIGPPRDAAYHLFTSGTTGVPKLVTHPETTVQRFITWQTSWLAATVAKPVTMMMSGPSHDPVLRDILLPLSTGGTVCIPTQEELGNPYDLRSFCDDAGVTVLHLTPASGRLLAIGADTGAFQQVQAVFWGGDRLLTSQTAQWQTLAPRARQMNLYGASETPQAALVHSLGAEVAAEGTVPIGRPTAWTGAHLVGTDGKLVALGEVGEIVITLDEAVTGAQQSATTGEAPGHATGDLGYAMPDGEIRFIGRSDRQVQFNGYRIELAEIETAAEKTEGVASAAALVGGADEEQLCLFVARYDADLSEPAVRVALAQALPSFMLPTRIKIMDQMPLSRNGKVDLDALRKELLTPQLAATDEALVGAEETSITLIFKRNTGIDATSRRQSLVDLGVDSLSMIETRLELEAHGFELPEGWEWMPISDLAHFGNPSRLPNGNTRAIYAPVRVDTWMVVRCLAIIQVVLHHFGVPLFSGASVLLITLAGLSFGQMQLPAILRNELTGRVWAQIARLLIPLVPASLLIYLLHMLLGRDPHPAALLFYQNLAPLIDVQILGLANEKHMIVWLWFLHAYLQIFLTVGVLLSVPGVLGWVRKQPWRSVLTLFCVSWGLMLVLYVLVQLYGQDPGTVRTDIARATTSILPFFCLGLLFALASTRKRKATVTLLAVLHFAFMRGVLHIHEEWLWLAGLALCLSVGNFKLPRLIATVVTAISAQSLMIYLTHIPVFILINRSFPENPHVFITAAIALFVGVALGNAFRPIYRKLGVNGLAEKRVVFRPRNATGSDGQDRDAHHGPSSQ